MQRIESRERSKVAKCDKIQRILRCAVGSLRSSPTDNYRHDAQIQTLGRCCRWVPTTPGKVIVQGEGGSVQNLMLVGRIDVMPARDGRWRRNAKRERSLMVSRLSLKLNSLSTYGRSRTSIHKNTKQKTKMAANNNTNSGGGGDGEDAEHRSSFYRSFFEAQERGLGVGDPSSWQQPQGEGAARTHSPTHAQRGHDSAGGALALEVLNSAAPDDGSINDIQNIGRPSPTHLRYSDSGVDTASTNTEELGRLVERMYGSGGGGGGGAGHSSDSVLQRTHAAEPLHLRPTEVGRGYSEAVQNHSADEEQLREQYRIMALNEARMRAEEVAAMRPAAAASGGAAAGGIGISSSGSGGNEDHNVARSGRPSPPKPRRARPPPPPKPIEPPMPLPRTTALSSIDEKYTAEWRKVPDLCTGQIVELKENDSDNARRGNSGGAADGSGRDLPASVLLERAIVGDDEHLVRCRSCSRPLRVHKMACLVRCPQCSSVSPATTIR